ncbi:uncharacterized protein [Ciconia boyciana]|uniref:uncharacterized protein isoform X2 n=1 Tax=Ciconia boyciana TaxID=52775 RepID=UPI003B9F3BC3
MLVSRMEREERETPANDVEEMSGRANVTLDPDTANPFLILAGDQRGVGRGDEWTSLPNNPERFDTEPRPVPGSQGEEISTSLSTSPPQEAAENRGRPSASSSPNKTDRECLAAPQRACLPDVDLLRRNGIWGK